MVDVRNMSHGQAGFFSCSSNRTQDRILRHFPLELFMSLTGPGSLQIEARFSCNDSEVAIVETLHIGASDTKLPGDIAPCQLRISKHRQQLVERGRNARSPAGIESS